MPSSAELSAQPIDSPHKTIVMLRQGHTPLFRCIVDGQEVQIEAQHIDETDLDPEDVMPNAVEPDRSSDFIWRIEGFTLGKQYYLGVIHTPRTGVYAQRFLVSEGLPLGLPLFCESIAWEQLSALCAERSPDTVQAFSLTCSNPTFGVLALHIHEARLKPVRNVATGVQFDTECIFRGRLENGLRVKGYQYQSGSYATLELSAS